MIYIAGGFVLGEVLALLPVDIGAGILALSLPGFLWLCGKRMSSRKPWIWLLLFLCCVTGYGKMWGCLRADPGREALLMTRGKPVTVCGDVAGISRTEKSWALTLTRCYLVWRDETYAMPDMLAYVAPEEFEGRGDERDGEQGGAQEDTWENAQDVLRLGMTVSVYGKPEKPSAARNPGEFDFELYYRALGIRYQMFGKDMKILDGTYRRYRDGLYRLRLRAGKLLEQICEPQDMGIMKAAILGDKASLDEEVRDLYQRNGIAHLLAISGLHISMVGLGVYRMLRRMGLGYGSAGVVGAAVIVSYGVLTGGSSSVVRAVSMVLIYILAEYLGRSYDMLSAAGLACVLLLWEHPGLLTQAGFQLSFGAVAAIGGLGPWMVKQLAVTKSWEKTVILGASVQMVTAPVILYHFYQYPVYGIVLNLAVIPLMAYVIVSGLAGIFLGAVWLPAGIAAVGSGHYILEFYLWLCRRCGKLPGANYVAGRPQLWQIGLYGALLAALLWLVCRQKQAGTEGEEGAGAEGKAGADTQGETAEGEAERIAEKRAGRVRRKREAVLAVGAVLCFLVLRHVPVKGMEVTFLDVGQGDGICIRTEEAVILVDGGSSDKKDLGENTLEPYLKSLGICRVDYAVISHGDQDHISGIEYLLEENQDIRIRNLLLPWLGREDTSYDRLAELMAAHGGQVHWMKEGESIRAGEMELTCIYHGREEKKAERNEQSLVLWLHYGRTGMLLTGDMSSEGEADMIAEKKLEQISGEGIQILKAAHHGSKYSSSEAFLGLVSPKWAVISCGEGNSYGHPHEETLGRLSAQGAEILITEDTGAITAQTDGTELSIDTFLP